MFAIAVAAALAAEAAGPPDLDPVRGAVDGAAEAGWVDERFQQQQSMADRAGQSLTKRRVHSASTREPRLRGAPGRSRKRQLLVSRCSRSNCTAKLQPIHRSRAAHFSAGAENTTSASHWPR